MDAITPSKASRPGRSQGCPPAGQVLNEHQLCNDQRSQPKLHKGKTNANIKRQTATHSVRRSPSRSFDAPTSKALYVPEERSFGRGQQPPPQQLHQPNRIQHQHSHAKERSPDGESKSQEIAREVPVNKRSVSTRKPVLTKFTTLGDKIKSLKRALQIDPSSSTKTKVITTPTSPYGRSMRIYCKDRKAEMNAEIEELKEKLLNQRQISLNLKISNARDVVHSESLFKFSPVKDPFHGAKILPEKSASENEQCKQKWSEMFPQKGSMVKFSDGLVNETTREHMNFFAKLTEKGARFMKQKELDEFEFLKRKELERIERNKVFDAMEETMAELELGSDEEEEEGDVSRFDLLLALTQDEEYVVKQGMSGSGSRIVQSNFGANITVTDIRKLKPLVWLNDEIVNNYMMLLKQRSAEFVAEDPELPKCYFQSSFFYNKLSEDNTGYNYSNVARWTKRGAGKCDVFAMDMVFFPINISNTHWCLCVVYPQDKVIKYFDSMGGGGGKCLKRVLRWVEDEYKNKKGTELPDVDLWRTESPGGKVPQQDNGCDCGVFMCTFANYLSLKEPLTFKCGNMRFFRKRIAVSILKADASAVRR